MSDKSVNNEPTTHQESFSELLVQLAKSSAVVLHDEIQLVIQRIREKVKGARSGLLLIVTGTVIGFVAVVCLCAALIMELASYMSPVIAALVTGAVLAFVSVVIVFTGYRQLKVRP